MSILGFVVGDSISAGTWPPLLNTTVNDFAGGGNKLIVHIEPTYQSKVDNAINTTVYTVIQGGVNDAVAGETLADIKTALTSIVTSATTGGLTTLVMGMTPWKNNVNWTSALQTLTDDYNTWLAAQASIQGFTYLDIYTALEDPGTDELLAANDSGDGLHPNATGDAIVAGVANPIIDSLFTGINMADAKISALPAVTTAATTDEFAVNQGGTSKKMTRAQMHSLETGEQITLPLGGSAGAPTVAFGDGNTGFWEVIDNSLSLAIAGVQQFTWNGTAFMGPSAGNFYIPHSLTLANGTTIPTYSWQSDTDTGISHHIADNVSVICGAIEALRVEDSADLAATETSLWLYDLDNGALQQVSVGADDSGGVGFKVLRIAN